MTRQLATMVNSGMTILRALYVLEAQTENELLQETIVKVRKDVEAGLPLSDALERHPKIFSPLFVAMARAGETGGVLEQALHARRRPAREGGAPAPPGQVGDGLPAVVITFAVGVLIALVDLPRAGLRRRLRAVRRRPAADHQVHRRLSNLMTGYWWG